MNPAVIMRKHSPGPLQLRRLRTASTGMLWAFIVSLAVALPGTAPVQAQAISSAASAAPAAQDSPGSPSAEPAKPAKAKKDKHASPRQDGSARGEPQTEEENGQFTIKQNVNEVNLLFTVTDKGGHFIRNLQQKDFALLDNQRAPAQIFSFTQQTNLPLRVGILIDTSTSIRRRFRFEQDAAIGFLQQVIRPKTDEAFVMGFDTTIYVTQNYTNSQDSLQQGIDKLEPGGGTALFDAVYKACQDHLLNVPSSPSDMLRKALILISDGDDNQSRAYPDDAIKMCQRAGAAIYAISTNVSPSRDRGDEVLKKMAIATGGRAFFPKRMEDMAGSFHNIEEELRSQYALAYRPADFKADGSFRTIYLVALNRRYIVNTRKGYFAPTSEPGEQARGASTERRTSELRR